MSDTGQYVCKATNIAGQVDKNFHLNVYGRARLSVFTHESSCICATMPSQFSAVPPRIEGPAEEDIAETLGNPVSFACDATGIPPPALAWLKNGRPIGGAAFPSFSRLEMEKCVPLAFTCPCELFSENSESLEMHIFSGGGKLQIARSQVSDSGTYTCVASNVEGRAHKSYRLTIRGKCRQTCMYAAAPCWY